VAGPARPRRALGGARHDEPSGQERVPENHPLSLGSGGRSISKQLNHFLKNADLIFGIGCSFATTNYGVAMPKGKRIAHATLDATDINKDVPADLALVGDAGLTLQALIVEVKDRLKGGPPRPLLGRHPGDQESQERVAGQWTPRLTQDTKPPVALPRPVGPDAHGRRCQHDHHARRR
jgi:acetolactate synthase-1/2/3 large subunit